MAAKPTRFSDKARGSSPASQRPGQRGLPQLRRAPPAASHAQTSRDRISEGSIQPSGGDDGSEDVKSLAVMQFPTHRLFWFGRDYIGGWMAGLWVITLLAILVLLLFVRV
jgi:hypothetical protein